MKKVLIGIALIIGVTIFVVPQFFKKPKVESVRDNIAQRNLDDASSVSAEKEKSYIENRILGISHLYSAYANEPSELKNPVAPYQHILSEMKSRLEEVIRLLDEGKTKEADNAYQSIQIETTQASNLASKRRQKLEGDFRAALDPYYKNGRFYTEEEWDLLKVDLKNKLSDRNIEDAHKAYLMNPIDNAQKILIDQLEILNEREQLLFYYRLDYEISYKLLKAWGSLTSALDFGVALNRFTDQNDKVITVLKGPVEQIMSDANVDISRYSTPLIAYLSALRSQGMETEFKQFSQTIVNSSKNKIATLDKQVPTTGTMSSMSHFTKAAFREEGAKVLFKLNLVEEAITLAKEARTFLEGKDAARVAELDNLIKQYQRAL